MNYWFVIRLNPCRLEKAMPFSRDAYPLDLTFGIIIVHARLGGPKGRRLIRMVLDTAATDTVITPRIISDIGYDPAKSRQKLEMATANGMIFAPLLRIESLQCLGRTVKAIQVAVQELPLVYPVDGLLGLDFLCRFDIALRFRSRQIEISS